MYALEKAMIWIERPNLALVSGAPETYRLRESLVSSSAWDIIITSILGSTTCYHSKTRSLRGTAYPRHRSPNTAVVKKEQRQESKNAFDHFKRPFWTFEQHKNKRRQGYKEKNSLDIMVRRRSTSCERLADRSCGFGSCRYHS